MIDPTIDRVAVERDPGPGQFVYVPGEEPQLVVTGTIIFGTVIDHLDASNLEIRIDGTRDGLPPVGAKVTIVWDPPKPRYRHDNGPIVWEILDGHSHAPVNVAARAYDKATADRIVDMLNETP